MTGSSEQDSISVVIPTYNRRSTLAAIIEPLRADPATGELVIVVDGGDDGSMEMLLAWSRDDPRLRPIYQDNAGSNAARERGVREATGSVVLMLDDDVEADPGLVSGHLRYHAARRGLVVVGYMPVSRTYRPGTEATIAAIYSDSYEETCRSYEKDSTAILKRLWSGNVSMRRDDVLRVGLAAPFEIRYHVDLEFGLRCARAGLVGLFDRSLSATHHYARTLDQFSRDNWRGGVAYAQILSTIEVTNPASLHPLSAFSLPRRTLSAAGSARLTRRGSKWLLRKLIRLFGRSGAAYLERQCVYWLTSLEEYGGYRQSRGPRLRKLRAPAQS